MRPDIGRTICLIGCNHFQIICFGLKGLEGEWGRLEYYDFNSGIFLGIYSIASYSSLKCYVINNNKNVSKTIKLEAVEGKI